MGDIPLPEITAELEHRIAADIWEPVLQLGHRWLREEEELGVFEGHSRDGMWPSVERCGEVDRRVQPGKSDQDLPPARVRVKQAHPAANENP